MSSHGTVARYVGYRCRCVLCKSANCKYQRQWRDARRAERVDEIHPTAPHGTLTAYSHYSCRCQLCLQARDSAVRVRKHRQYLNTKGTNS